MSLVLAAADIHQHTEAQFYRREAVYLLFGVSNARFHRRWDFI